MAYTLSRGLFVATALVLALCGCAPREPLRIGFIGGISGRVADLGINGRNGVVLAIEMRNKSGGIHGRPVELIVEDDKQDPEIAEEAFKRLIASKVETIIGPMTSVVAMACVPVANEAKMTVVSPTVSTAQLSGIDDYFLRVISPTTVYARKSAEFHARRLELRQVAVAYDIRNQSYTESWLNDYRQTFESQGGRVVATTPFTSSDEVDFSRLARQLREKKPGAVLIIANSVDTAMLAQQLRKLDPATVIATSEWAATERLTELGGKAIDGMILAQFLDRDSQQPAYLAFRKTYLERYAVEPSFGALAGFDAANVVLDALSLRKPGESLKQTILAQKIFSGAQSEIRFDANGDASRETFIFIVRNGNFVRQH